jgi:hypothetical protein
MRHTGDTRGAHTVLSQDFAYSLSIAASAVSGSIVVSRAISADISVLGAETQTRRT